MTPTEAIAAINAKAEAEHRAVEAKREELVRQVQAQCVHERDIFPLPDDPCKHCGAQMPGSEV